MVYCLCHRCLHWINMPVYLQYVMAGDVKYKDNKTMNKSELLTTVIECDDYLKK